MSDGPQEVGKEVSPQETSEARWLAEALWLGPQVAAARAVAFAAGQPGYEHYDLARQLRDESGRIVRIGRETPVVLLLDCVAVDALVRAHLARAGQPAGSAELAEGDWDRARHLPELQAAFGGFTEAHLATLRTMLGAERLAALLQMPEAERTSFTLRMRALVSGLIAPLEAEANRLGWLLFQRWARVAVAAVALLAVLAYAMNAAFSKVHPNLALHRPVEASSLNGYGPDPSRLVDGVTDMIAFHTNGGEQQWVVIDLGEVKKFEEVVVYNRPGCCAERAVPLEVEVSNDNKEWRQIAQRDQVFDKWTAGNLHAEGRYVRLKNAPPNFFHLAEVEIY